MNRPKPNVARLCDLQPGQSADLFALLAEKSRGATRDGKPYFLCKFRDSQRTAAVMVWADGGRFEACEKEWKEGEFYKIRATYQESPRYGAQLEVQQIRLVAERDRDDGFDPGELVERSRFPSQEMYEDLRNLAGTEIADEPLRRLVLSILERHAGALQRLPATQDRFYPFAGGLLEHLLSVATTARDLADHYVARYPHLKPPLNRDLVIAGAVLHDIGRVVELGDEPVSPQPTVPGRLFGHLLLGRDIIRDAAREQGDVNPELTRMLEHLVLTHLALPEWGSPRLPLIPEVLIVHHADDLDAKIEMFARCLSRDREPGPFTARDPGLGKKLLKGRSV